MDVPLLGQNNSGQNEEEAQELNVTTAWLVYLTPDGQYAVSGDINIPVIPERGPTRDEIIAGSHVAIKDLTIQETLENIPQVLMQFNMVMQKRMQDAQLQQEVMRHTQR